MKLKEESSMKSARSLGLALLIVLFAFGLFGCSSSSDPEETKDTTAPGLSSVVATTVSEIQVKFDEQVDKTTAEDASNYTITQTPASLAPWMSPPVISQVAVAIQTASLDADGQTVRLTTDPLDPFGTYELSVTGILDLAGNALGSVNKAAENKIQSGKIFTMAGTGYSATGGENVDPLEADLWWPQDVTFSPDGLPYILDWNNHRVRVIENGLVHTVLGTGILGDANPGPATQTGLNHPTNIVFDANGDMIVAAWHNSKVLRVNLTTGWCEPIVGDAGNRAFSGDGGPAIDADVDLPVAVQYDKNGILYIADQANRRIRTVDQNGIINTWAGGSHGDTLYCGDGGPAIDACLGGSRGQNAFPTNRIAFDDLGNLYIADTMNHRIRIIDTSGIINTFAGNGFKEFSGDGGDATAAGLDSPGDVAAGIDGEIYIADTENHVVRMVKDGVITTFAGQGRRAGYGGDGGRPTEAILNEPYGVAVDSDGNVYIADTSNNRMRVVYR